MTSELRLLNFRDAIAKEAFRGLLDYPQPLSTARLADLANTDEQRVLEAISGLLLAGRAELDDEDRVLGVYGLTLKPTQHRLELRGATYFVWCAFDAVGIPAALSESAAVTSECSQSGRELHFNIEDGKEPSLPLVISWLPRQCESVREQFCPTVNFYCDSSHYRSSLPPGQAADAFITLQTAVELGRETWGWASSPRGR